MRVCRLKDLYIWPNITFDWYTRDTRDLLMSKMVDPITGFGSIMDNIGRMRNTGFELEVRSTNIDNKDFTWTSTFMMTHNKNKVLKLADVPQYFTGNYYVVKEGYSLGTICLREYAGVDPQKRSAYVLFQRREGRSALARKGVRPQ